MMLSSSLNVRLLLVVFSAILLPIFGYGQDISKLTILPNPVAGLSKATGTVLLTKAAGTAGLTIMLTSSSTTAATVPASVKVPAGAKSATFSITTYAVKAISHATIKGVDPLKKSASVALTVDMAAVRVTALAISPTVVQAAHSAKGTITLSEVAPSAGFTVSLSSSSSFVTLPTSVTVHAGSKTATFTATAGAVKVTSAATLTAQDANGYEASAKLTVDLPVVRLATLVISPITVQGGAASKGTVTLTGNAPTGGLAITLLSKQSYINVPSSVVVKAGSKVATFSIGTTQDSVTSTGTVTATDPDGYSASASLTVNAPALRLTTITVSPNPIFAANTATGTVTLSQAAPTSGFIINLSTNQQFIELPTSVTVAGGATTATFPITTLPVSTAGAASVTGTDPNNTSATGNFTVNVPAVHVFALKNSQPSVAATGSLTSTVTLSANAPAGGFVVALASDSAYVQVPKSVTVKAGAASATFSITTTAVTETGVATLSATDANQYISTASLIVAPQANGQTVQMTDFHAFVPQMLTVAAGTTVTWTNPGTQTHTATGDIVSQGIKSNPTAPGQSFTWTVPANAKSGTIYYYHCIYHGFAGSGSALGVGMVGAIVVK